jgi:mercuric ion transport protein
MNVLDKIGAGGTIAAAFGMSCCLPLFAVVGSAIGLGFLAQYESEMNYLMQAAVVLAVVGTLWAYRKHRSILPVIIGIVSAGVIIYSVNTNMNSSLIYGGLAGLVATAILNAIYTKRCGNCEIGGKP